MSRRLLCPCPPPMSDPGAVWYLALRSATTYRKAPRAGRAARHICDAGCPEAVPQREQRVQLPHAQQPAAEQVHGDRRRQGRAERDDLGGERMAERRVERPPDDP